MKVQGRIRRTYSPLDINAGYVVSGTGLKQVFKAVELEHEPDRSLINTIITPVVVIHDKDGVFAEGNANRKLTTMKWYVNGVDVTTLNDYTNGIYIIDTSDTISRGALTVKKNVVSSSPIKLTFKAVIADTRNAGTNINIALENIMLTTEDVSADKYTLEIDHPVDNTYNPIGLSEFNYAVGANVYLGADLLASITGLTFALYYMVGTGKYLCTTSNSPEVLEITGSTVHFDLRLISRRTYFLQLKKDGIEQASVQFSIARKYPPYALDMMTFGDLRKGQSVIPAKAIVHAGKTLIVDPGLYFAITWHTVSTVKGDVTHNMGSVAEIPTDISGVDFGAVDIYYDLDEKAAHQVATNSLGEIFTDSLGEQYIFN
jgi:hypothetical protein